MAGHALSGSVLDPRATHRVTPTGCSEVFEVDTRYKSLRFIGGGAYGTVASAEDVSSSRRVAIKKIKDVFRDATDAKRILRELKLLRLLGGHENISWVVDIMVSPPLTTSTGRGFKDVYIVTDLMDTDLSHIIESPQPLSNAHIKYFIYQLLRGLKYTHTAGVLHRDLKPQNILVNSNCELVVADFGLARAVGVTDGESLPDDDLTTYVVTRWYRAPELLLNVASYDLRVDMWAVGCILAELVGRRPLFPGRTYKHQLQLILETCGTPGEEELKFLKGQPALAVLKSLPARRRVPWSKLFPGADPLALDLMDRMLTFDPSRRITTVEALSHPYLADYACEADEPAAAPLPAAEFEFDKRATLSRAELAEAMLAEMALFRPGVGLAAAARPQSTRLAAHSTAVATAAAKPPLAAPIASSVPAGKAKPVASTATAAAAAPAAAAGPTRTSSSGALTAASAPVPAPAPGGLRKSSSNGSTGSTAGTVVAATAGVAAVVDTAPAHARRPSGGPTAPAAPAAAVVPPPPAAALPVPAGAPSGADITAILVEQLRSLRGDILAAVDSRLSQMETNVMARFEASGKRLEHLEAAVGALQGRR